HRRARVLYIDGELPGDLLQERIKFVYRLFGFDPNDPNPPEGPIFLSHEDCLSMRPLDTEEGQQWLDSQLKQEKFRDVDYIIFDNLQSLCAGNLKDEEGW